MEAAAPPHPEKTSLRKREMAGHRSDPASPEAQEDVPGVVYHLGWSEIGRAEAMVAAQVQAEWLLGRQNRVSVPFCSAQFHLARWPRAASTPAPGPSPDTQGGGAGLTTLLVGFRPGATRALGASSA